MIRFFAFILILLSYSNSLLAQIARNERPHTFYEKNIKDNVEIIKISPINSAQLLAEDEKEKDLPWRFGKDIDVNINLLNSGTWITLPNGDRIWRLKIHSENAYSINLIYDSFFLPENGTFHLYNESKNHVIGAFTSENNKSNGKFATGVVKGDLCVLEYFEPHNQSGKGVINISKVVHAYKDIFNKVDKAFGSSGSCNNNINCAVGNDWQDEKKSVALILTNNNSRICTGALVNNVKEDNTPYFLTANHCFNSTTDTENWIFMFNYESPDCSNIDGFTSQTITGCAVKARNADSDFLLVELSSVPPESYNVYYAGWSRLDSASSNSTGIHHPRGDIKKISFDNHASVSSDYDPRPYLPNSHWEITKWDDGTTEPGSSGSPLFDQNSRLIGQLHGGWASCRSFTADFYGKFSMSWDRGTSSSKRLKDWLDPNNTGVITLNGTYPNTLCPESLSINTPVTSTIEFRAKYITASNSISRGADVSYNAGEKVRLKPGFKAANGSSFRAYIDGCGSSTSNLAAKQLTENTEIVSTALVDESISVTIYPNPTSRFVTISSGKLISSWELMDINGKLVMSDKSNNEVSQTKIDLEGLGSDLYILKTTFSDNSFSITKLIKN